MLCVATSAACLLEGTREMQAEAEARTQEQDNSGRAGKTGPPCGSRCPQPFPQILRDMISALEIQSREGTLVFLKLEAEFWLFIQQNIPMDYLGVKR